MKERIFKYDFIRAFAILTVVANHIFTGFFHNDGEYEFAKYLNTIDRFGVGIFLFLAGFFFHPVKDTAYLWGKIKRVLIPYTFASILAFLYYIIIDKWGFNNIPELALAYVFGYKFGYFFIFVIISLYVIAHLIVRFNLFKRIKIVLLVSLILQFAWLALDQKIFDTFNLNNIFVVQYSVADLLLWRNPFTWGYFFILGMWYQTGGAQKLIKKFSKWIIVLLIVVFELYNLQIHFDYGDYNPYQSIPWSILCTLIIFALLQFEYNFKSEKLKRIFTYLSTNSYAIYLLHNYLVYMLHYWQAHGGYVPYWTTPLIYIASIALSLLIVEIAKRVSCIPFLRKKPLLKQ